MISDVMSRNILGWHAVYKTYVHIMLQEIGIEFEPEVQLQLKSQKSYSLQALSVYIVLVLVLVVVTSNIQNWSES
jgi:hypothetical protein